MNLITSSRFTQITPYALLEYTYNSNVISTRDADFYRCINAFTGSTNLFNYNQFDYSLPKKLTGNVLDYTVQPIDENVWVHLDIDKPLRFFEQQNEALFFQPIYLGRTTEINVVYDSIKVHIVSGYNFDDLGGFIIRASYVDNNNGKQIHVANIAYLKEDTHISLNKTPMLIGDRVYDKYIEIKIPSLKSITDSELQTKEIFNSVINYGNVVYKNLFDLPDYNNSKINLVFYEIQDYYETDNGQVLIKTALPLGNNTQGVIRTEILNYDNFSNLVANVQESVVGDYFEIFPMYNSEFLEDFIMDQARLGHNYIGIHDIELYEQISSFGDYDEILTHKQSFFQEDGFDQVFKFRPVIENANAVTFTIEYTFRLLDKVDNSQVIRRATYTFPDASKYGRWMQKLNIPIGYQPIKIVNKIIRNIDSNTGSNVYNLSKGSSIATSNTTTSSIVPFQFKDISVNSYTLFVDSTSQLTTKVIYENIPNTIIDTNKISFEDFNNSNVIYGQGDCKIYINQYDNFLKFKIYKYVDKKSGIPEVFKDLKSTTNLNFYLVFRTSTGEEIRINEFSKIENIKINSDEDGVLIFKINTTDAQKIIKDAVNDFYIIIENKISGKITGTNAWNAQKDFETVLYSGKWDLLNNYNQIEQVDYDIKSKILNSLVNKLKVQETNLKTLKDEYDVFLNSIKNLQLTSTQASAEKDFTARWDEIINQAKSI